MKRLLLIRTRNHPRATLGVLFVLDENGEEIFKASTLELPWKNNQVGISRIPEGQYPVVYEHSPAFRRSLWELKDVPGRSEVKFHTANFARQLEGCIALGANHKDIDGDQIPDVTSSDPTMTKFHKALEDQQGKTIYLTVTQATNLTW